MSSPLSRGAANYNRLISLKRKLNRVSKNIAAHNSTWSNLMSQRMAAHRAAISRLPNNRNRQKFERQRNRISASVARITTQLNALRNEQNVIRREMSNLIGVRRRVQNLNENMGQLRRIQGTRLAHLIEAAYLRPGGMHTKRTLSRLV